MRCSEARTFFPKQRYNRVPATLEVEQLDLDSQEHLKKKKKRPMETYTLAVYLGRSKVSDSKAITVSVILVQCC